MKLLGTISLISFSLSVSAHSYRCASTELEDGTPLVSFKVSPLQKAANDPSVDDHFILGVTSTAQPRYSLYSTGAVTDQVISLDFVEEGFITGYATITDQGGPGVLEGEFRHTKLRGAPFHMRCHQVESRVFSRPRLDIVSSTFTLVTSSLKRKK